MRDSYARHGFGLWAVVMRANGRVIGDCGPMLQPVDGSTVGRAIRERRA